MTPAEIERVRARLAWAVSLAPRRGFRLVAGKNDFGVCQDGRSRWSQACGCLLGAASLGVVSDSRWSADHAGKALGIAALLAQSISAGFEIDPGRPRPMWHDPEAYAIGREFRLWLDAQRAKETQS